VRLGRLRTLPDTVVPKIERLRGGRVVSRQRGGPERGGVATAHGARRARVHRAEGAHGADAALIAALRRSPDRDSRCSSDELGTTTRPPGVRGSILDPSVFSNSTSLLRVPTAVRDKGRSVSA
jgi:hypothetical protein